MNELEKEFLPYEIALALKELGFDEPCFATYHKELHAIIPIYAIYTNQDVIKAPLYQQTFRWFRENYNLHSRVDIQDVELDWYSFEILEVRDGDYNNNLHTDMNFKSHEQAETACIKKLIELANEKKIHR
jgi:hypothetical protein